MAFVRLRPQQEKFSQAVKKRDGECILTGATHPSVLEAAHLHAHALCKNQAHAFYRANGITLHASLHCLFDTGHIGFYVAPDGVHLYVQAQDRATIVCLQEIAPRLTPNQLVPKFPTECIEYLVKRNTT